MKGIICFFSTTGNTMLVSKYIASKIKSGDTQLFDISKGSIPDLKGYNFVGFATYTDYWGPPKLMEEFIEKLPSQKDGKPAFVLNAHAGESGKTLMILNDWVKSKGFKVIAGHSIITPVNFPPVIAQGWSNPDDPDEPSFNRLNEFIFKLDQNLKNTTDGINVDEFEVILDEEDMSFIYPVRTKAKDEMGELFVDPELCSGCKVCVNVCPYKAIRFESEPIFDQGKCYGCWACFNRCPKKAIYTENVRGKGHYPWATDKFMQKLKVIL